MNETPPVTQALEVIERPAPTAVGKRILDIASQMKTDPDHVGPFFYDVDVAGPPSSSLEQCSRKMAEYLSEFKGQYKRVVEELVQDGLFDAAVLERLDIVAFAPMFLVQGKDQAYHGADIENGFVVLKNMKNELAGVHELTHLLLPGVSVHVINEGFQQTIAKIIYSKMAILRPNYDSRAFAFYTNHQKAFWEAFRLSGWSLEQWTKMSTQPDIAQNTRFLLGVNVQVNGIWGNLGDHVNYLEKDYAQKLLPKGSRGAIAALDMADFQEQIARKIADDLQHAPSPFAYN